MTKLLTITMNPALDVSTAVEEMRHTSKLRCEPMQRRAGGGGVNVARELHRLIVRVSDRPGVFQAIMVALGDAGINIEDLQMHHMSAELGGTLTVYVLGEAAAERGAHVLAGLGYDVITGAEAE